MFVAGGIGELIRGYFYRRLPLFLGVSFLLVMGLVFGAVAVQTLPEHQQEDLTSYLQNFYATFPQEIEVSNQRLLARQGMIDNILKTTGLMWLLGLTVIGAPFILGLIFLRGFVIGFTVGFLIEQMVLRGVVLSVASVLPHNLLIVPAILLGGGATLSFSWAALKTLLGANNESIYHQFISCTFVVLISFGLLGLAAFVEAYITPVFIQLIQGI